MRIPFCRHSYVADSLPLSAQRCVNLIPEIQPKDARSPLLLYGSPGMVAWATCETTGGPLRGQRLMGNSLWAVIGATVYVITSTGIVTALAGTVSGSGPVTMAGNGSQVAICAAPAGYIATTSTLTQITDPDFPGVSSVTEMDGYFIWTDAESGQFFISDLLNGLSYDALDFATAEGAPDDLVRGFADHRELWLFGTQTTEIWVNTGDATFPFARQEGTFLEKGCAAPYSVAAGDNTIFWLSSDKIIYRAVGYAPQRISTHAIERAIENMAAISDAEGWFYTQDGHSFYVLTFPTERQTFVYDAATKLWHERKSGTDEFARWRASHGVNAFGKTLVGDTSTATIYRLDKNIFTEAGSVIQRVGTSPPLYAAGKRATMSNLEIEIETGVGLVTGQGADPQIVLQWSDDSARTWSSEQVRSFGTLGAYTQRVRWNRLGSFRDRVLRFTVSDPVKFNLFGASAEVEGLAS